MLRLKKGTPLTVAISECVDESLAEGTRHRVANYTHQSSGVFSTDTGWYVRHGEGILYIMGMDRIFAILEQPDT